MGDKNDAVRSATLDIAMIVEIQPCDPLAFASVPIEYNDLQSLDSVEVHGKHILASSK